MVDALCPFLLSSSVPRFARKAATSAAKCNTDSYIGRTKSNLNASIDWQRQQSLRKNAIVLLTISSSKLLWILRDLHGIIPKTSQNGRRCIDQTPHRLNCMTQPTAGVRPDV
eukprot:1341463-Amphidinium_carterae.1